MIIAWRVKVESLRFGLFQQRETVSKRDTCVDFGSQVQGYGKGFDFSTCFQP